MPTTHVPSVHDTVMEIAEREISDYLQKDLINNHNAQSVFISGRDLEYCKRLAQKSIKDSDDYALFIANLAQKNEYISAMNIYTRKVLSLTIGSWTELFAFFPDQLLVPLRDSAVSGNGQFNLTYTLIEEFKHKNSDLYEIIKKEALIRSFLQ